MTERRYKNPQVNLRLPEDLKLEMAELSKEKGRSLNTEMVMAIEHWVKQHRATPALSLAEITQRLIELEQEVERLGGKKRTDIPE